MSSIRTRLTEPERNLGVALKEAGIRFRRNVKGIPGTPDFYLPDHATAVFVHGCFWHGHGACLKGRHRPKTNRRFWAAKLVENRRRDRRIARRLRAMGISVYTIWECEVKRTQLPARLRRRLAQEG